MQQVVLITAVDMLDAQRHWAAVALDYDKCVERINTRLRRVFNHMHPGNENGWEDLPLADSHSYIRSTALGQLHFTIERLDVT